MREANTLGRRIQEGRKAAGLSQETLGEKLEVSRQAVSKWESDAAIPELEKLIAMSRLFGMTVGALLGVEEPAEAAGELTGRELAAAEAIAERMAGTRPRWSRRRRLLAVCAGALAGVLLLALTVGTIFLNVRTGEMQSRIDALEGRVSGLGNGVVQYIPSQPEPDGLLLTYDLTPVRLDVQAGAAIFRVSATPREQTEGASAVFTAQLSDGRRLSCDAAFDQGAFVAGEWSVPLDDRIEISITLTEGGTSRTGMVETLYDFGPESTKLDVLGDWGASWWSDGAFIEFGTVYLEIRSAGEAAGLLRLVPAAVDFCIYRNGGRVPEQIFPAEDLLEEFLDNWEYDLYWENNFTVSNRTGYETRVDLKPGDTVVAAVRVTDNYGQTVYDAEAWTKGDNGIEHISLPEDWTPGTPLE